jgi:hypothetical protein
MRRAPSRSSVLMSAVLVLTGSGVLAACNSDEGNTGEAYCGTIQENLTALASPAIVTAEDIDLTLELYRSIADRAPAAVEPEWQQLVLNLETASTVDPNDPASLQLAADTARASTSAATRVQEYTSQTCGLQIGQVPAITLPPTTVAE